MFKIILDVEITHKDKLLLKDKQSIIYNIMNMFSEYGKLLHTSMNNVKTGFSYYINKDKTKIYINVSNERFDGLDLKNYIKNNVNKKIEVKNGISVIYSEYKIVKVPNEIFDTYDILETLSPIYISTRNNEDQPINLELEIKEDTISNISNQILQNINNYTKIDLTSEDLIVIPTYQTRLLTGFSDGHAWSCYYVTIHFKTTQENIDKIRKAKEILMTNFYKSSYTGYFILK